MPVRRSYDGQNCIFDLDDTLYKRCKPFETACGAFFKVPLSKEVIEKAFEATQRRCEEVYFPCRRGEMTKEEGFIYRYTKGFEDVGIPMTPQEALRFKDLYQEAQKNIETEPEVRELLEKCRKHFAGIGIVSNGPSLHQREKIRVMGLDRLVDEELIVISEDIGIDKPDVRIFDYARKMAGLPASKLTYVGDSPLLDVEAAKKAGWKAVLWEGDPEKAWESLRKED